MCARHPRGEAWIEKGRLSYDQSRMAEAPVKRLTAAQLNTAMRLNVLTGCLATVWQIVCSIQPIFNVFVNNELGASASMLGALVGLLQLSALFQLASIFIYGYAPRKKSFFVAWYMTIMGVVSVGGSDVGGFLLDALSPVDFWVGPLCSVNFHFLQSLSILMVVLSAWIISRVREGRERLIGFVVGVANLGII